MKTTVMMIGILGALAGSLRAQEDSDADPRRQEIVNKLNTMRLTLDFKDATLDDVLSYIRDFSGLNIVIDAEVTKIASPEQLKVSLHVKDLLLKSCLKLMLNSR